MAKGLIKNIIGIIFIPVLISVTKSFYSELIGIEALTMASKYFLFGLLAYLFIYVMFFKMDYLYIFGHECVHALCVWLCGGRILSFSIGRTGGNVTATKSNIFIDLAPYLIPIYTILISLAYVIGSSFWEMEPFLGYFIFFMGFSFSFHIIMTIDKVKIEQPDFLKLGYLNSLALIYLVNVVMLALFLGFLFTDFSSKDFFSSFFTNTKELYVTVFEQLFGYE